MESRVRERLTDIESRIIELVAQGLGNEEIARELYVSRHTVKAHLSVILKKLRASNRTHATYIALKEHLIR